MQKSFVVIATFLLLSVFTISFASAAVADAINDFGTALWDVIEPLAVFLLGQSSDGALFMGRLLIFVILFSLVWIAIRQFPIIGESKGWVWLIAFAFSILAIRFTAEDWIETIILPYSAIGVALTAFFPLVVLFFFIEKGLEGKKTLRKIAWIFAIVVFVGMFIYRYDELNNNFAGTIGPSWVYIAAAVVSLLMLIFDRTIQGWMRQNRLDLVESTQSKELEKHYRRKIQEAFDDERNGIITAAERKKIVDQLSKKIRGLG